MTESPEERALRESFEKDIKRTPAPVVDPDDTMRIIEIDANLLVSKINRCGHPEAARIGSQIDALVQELLGQ